MRATSDYQLIFSCYEIRLVQLPCWEKQYSSFEMGGGVIGEVKGEGKLLNLPRWVPLRVLLILVFCLSFKKEQTRN